jgi:dephospho-CoA kinase
MGRRLRIGLTGGVASGKTTVARRFTQLGVPVIDADESARRVVAPGSPALAEIAERFGRGVLLPNGELDRRALRAVVFADEARRRELEAILHPLIREDMERLAAASGGPYVVLAIPLLIESGARNRVQRVLVVDCDEKTQLERLMSRDAVTRQQAEAIIAAQIDRAGRLRAADDVLANTGTIAELRRAVDQLHQRYLCMSETFAAASGALT